MGPQRTPTHSAALLPYGAAGRGFRGGVSRKRTSAQATAVAPEKRQTDRDRESEAGGGGNKGSEVKLFLIVNIIISVESSGITSVDSQGLV